MKSFNAIWAVCAQNFRKWQTDQRVWCVWLMLLFLTLLYTDDMKTVAYYIGTKPPLWTFPFLYSQFHTKLLFTFPIVLLYCNAPFVDNNQIFVCMRSGRTNWLCGQVLYVVLSSGIYYIFLFLMTILTSVFSCELSAQWGKTLPTLATSSAAANSGAVFIEVSEFVIEYFTPVQAVWFTFVLSWCSAVFLGMLIFVCNLLTGTKIAGILSAGLAVAICGSVEHFNMKKLLHFSPVSWNTLDNVDVGGTTSNPSFTYCICVYTALFILITVLILIFGRKSGFNMRGELK